MKLLQILIPLVTLVLCDSLAARALDVRTLTMAREQELPERYVKVADGYASLSFPATQPGKLVRALASTSALPLFELVKDSDGPPAYKMVEQIALPTGASGVLLLAWKSKEGLSHLAVDDDFLSAQYNEWLLVNTTTKSVALQIGSENKSLMIDANSVLDHKVNESKGTGVAVVAKAKWGEELKTFYSTYWPVREEARGVIVFFYETADRLAVSKITNTLLNPVDEPDQ